MLEHGVIERIGRGRGVSFILCHKFRSFLGKRGTYTRDGGLDRNADNLFWRSILARAAGRSRLQLRGYDAMNIIGKGQIRWLPKGDVVGQKPFIEDIFGIAV